MTDRTLVATAWNNGTSGKSAAGYGLKISPQDRDTFFRREWGTVDLSLPNCARVTVNIDKDSFWNNSCRELISSEIGRWMLTSGIAPWSRGKPPRFKLVPIKPRLFDVRPDEM
jgi:hypothetical protein